MKKHSYLTLLAALAAGSLASSAGFAQTSSSSGVNSGSPTTSSPMSGAPNRGSLRSEPTTSAPDTNMRSREPTPPPTSSAPSASAGTTMNSGPDRALATPEDRATCASLSGMTQADCIADVRKQRESRGRM